MHVVDCLGVQTTGGANQLEIRLQSRQSRLTGNQQDASLTIYFVAAEEIRASSERYRHVQRREGLQAFLLACYQEGLVRNIYPVD
jgi:hypothetical protein